MPAGKLGTQCGHGYLGAFVQGFSKDPERASSYYNAAQPKITVQVEDETQLRRVYKEAVDAGIPAALITDAGRTVFAEPTPTVCGFGPCYRSELPPFLKRLRLL